MHYEMMLPVTINVIARTVSNGINETKKTNLNTTNYYNTRRNVKVSYQLRHNKIFNQSHT